MTDIQADIDKTQASIDRILDIGQSSQIAGRATTRADLQVLERRLNRLHAELEAVGAHPGVDPGVTVADVRSGWK